MWTVRPRDLPRHRRLRRAPVLQHVHVLRHRPAQQAAGRGHEAGLDWFYTEQRAMWRHRATSTLGVAMAVGAAVGAATVTVAQVAFGLARGAMSAVSSTRGRDIMRKPLGDVAASSFQIESPPSPTPGQDSTTRTMRPVPKAKARSFSLGRRPDPEVVLSRAQAELESHCPACHSSNQNHLPHLRRGDCVGYPGRTWYAHHGSEVR